MKSKQLFQALGVLVILFSTMGNPSQAYARNPFSADNNFSPTRTPQLRGSIAFNKPEINRGEKVQLKATLDLGQIPSEGYTSIEYNCDYTPSDINIVVLENIFILTKDPEYIFGLDPAIAIYGPVNGKFIVAIARTAKDNSTPVSVVRGKMAAPVLARSPTVFTIDARSPTQSSVPAQQSALAFNSDAFQAQTPGLQTTPTPHSNPGNQKVSIDCHVRASTEQIKFKDQWDVSAKLNIKDDTNPATTATPTFTATVASIPTGSLSGQVFAGKLVTIKFFDATGALVSSMPVNPDGTFNVTVPAGTYTVVATAPGYLSAQGLVTITGNGSFTKGATTLLPGDIDGNNFIDQFDALTIGMNYNLPVPFRADLNNDGIINILDLEILAANYRKAGAIDWP